MTGPRILPARPQAPETTRALAGRLLRGAARGEAPAAPHLVVIAGRDAGRCIPLGSAETLGRGRRASVRLRDPAASRLHARVERSGDGFRVQDLGSKNGLAVNGARAAPGGHPLRPGDEVALGATRLRLVDPLAAAGAPAPGPPRAGHPAAWRAAAALVLLAAALSAAAFAF